MTPDQRAWLVIIGLVLCGAVIFGEFAIGDERLAALAGVTNIVLLPAALLLALTSAITIWGRWRARQGLLRVHQPSYYQYLWPLLWGAIGVEALSIHNYSLLLFCFSNVLFYMVRIGAA